MRAPTLPLIHFFEDSKRFGRHLAGALGVHAAPVALHQFPDGESLVRVASPAPRHAVLVRSLHDPNRKLIETVLAADALRRAGARRVTLVAPYLPYMRQDEVFRPGEPLSQQVIGKVLESAFDRVLTVEAHLHRVRHLSQVMPGRSLSAAPALAAWVRRHASGCVIVGPDAESAPWVRAIARRARSRWIVATKERLGDRRVRVTLPPLPECRRAVLVDDVASSGATLAMAARALRRAGATHVDAIVVHAIFAAGALRRIKRAGVDRLLSCDTIPHFTNAIHCAAIVAAALPERLR
jgi:ribose-phosphate pyrophosphokinase